MGQIIFNGQKPKYCNLVAIQVGGNHYNDSVDLNEIWLVDTTNSSKNSSGTGKYDAYIVGDGTSNAGQLVAKDLRYIDTPVDMSEYSSTEEMMAAISGEINKLSIPTELKQLADDATHRLVTDEWIQNWNNAAAGEGGTLIESSEDIKTITNQTTNLTHLELADKEYDAEEYSGLGKKILRKNIISTVRKHKEPVYDSLKNDAQGDSYVSDFTRVKRRYINSIKGYNETTIGDTIIGKTIDLTPGGRFSCSYCTKNVYAGEIYKITAQKSDVAGTEWASRFWVITGEPYTVEVNGAEKTVADVLQAYKPNYENLVNAIVQETVYIEVEQDGVLWVNYISYDRGTCFIEKISDTEESITINSITGVTEANTEYIIQYDFDLNGNVLELPENTVLNFAGGSIKNGYIKGNNSMIVAPNGANIMGGGKIFGNWKNIEFYPKWFGAAADGVTDDTEVLQTMLDISTDTGKQARLMWYGHSFKTTKGLFLKSNTHIYGGSITAQFENPLDWILQTFTIYYNVSADISAQVGYKYIASWQEFDGGSDSINHVTGCVIDGLSLTGTLNKHMVIPEGGDETSEKVWDNTYCPIFGGLKLNGASSVVKNVSIRNVGIGMARGACLHSYDSHLNISAKFLAYAARAVNTTVVENSYLNAWANAHDPSGNVYTPYYLEYQGFNKQPNVYMTSYIEGTGGTGDPEDELTRPLFCSVKLNYAGILFNNSITDSGAEVAFAATYSTLVINYPYFEGVSKCYVYAALTRMSLTMPEITSNPAEYDFIGSEVEFVFNNATSKINGSGGSSGTNHKYALASGNINFISKKPNNAPNDDRFYYLTNGDESGFSTASISGETLEAQVGKYYTVTSTVHNLAVTLPAMGSVTLLKAVILNLTTGDTPNITFTSADNKAIAFYSNYEILMNSTYEINCMYNGTKWIISASMIG